jgi:hypothetical protein
MAAIRGSRLNAGEIDFRVRSMVRAYDGYILKLLTQFLNGIE